jgi:hypothetical protein
MLLAPLENNKIILCLLFFVTICVLISTLDCYQKNTNSIQIFQNQQFLRFSHVVLIVLICSAHGEDLANTIHRSQNFMRLGLVPEKKKGLLSNTLGFSLCHVLCKAFLVAMQPPGSIYVTTHT